MKSSVLNVMHTHYFFSYHVGGAGAQQLEWNHHFEDQTVFIIMVGVVFLT